MAKRTTTTTTTFLPPFNYDDSEINESCEINVATQGFLNGVDFYVYLLALSPLAVCFLCCFPSYLAAFRRNAEAISASPFLPLINHSYRTIAFNYTTCIILGVLSKLFLDSGSRIP
ncbi:hypothetical protein GCK72_020787 [Caenorhabditis remanei]|uniref:Uncharacterized protein n=1 Tax=Caenorhabditis remanei TaxID=31234 RepID=A0A6A5GG82_CAERE|nr:hypothetical protein GCK72_020787 [Caenorhabditis remanei]KAF1754227.1 hypothetical protein GCK72_020787 [Caenorhabditis remanei]